MKRDSSEAHLPRPPELRRTIPGKARLLALLACLVVLPAVALGGWLEQQARSSVAHVLATFVVLTFAFRLIGKRELSRLSPFELVTLMLIPEILSNAVQGQGSMLTGLAGLSTVLLLVLGTSLLAQRFPRVHTVIESSPTVLVADGKLLETNMNRERVSPDELFSEMRKQGICKLADIRFAVLESGGNLTFVSNDEHRTSGDDGDNAAIG